MKITKKDLEISVGNLSARVSALTGKNVSYKLVMGDVRLGKLYSIQDETRNTICSFYPARELDAYIWGMYKSFELLRQAKLLDNPRP